MAKEKLIEEIVEAFKDADQHESWLFQSFENLLRLKQLSHFYIFEINWFPGAARILDLIDQLHTIETPKEDFMKIAQLLNLQVDNNLSKEEIARQVKSNKNWRVKSFELDRIKNIDMRKEELEPLYNELRKFGYETNLLPKQIRFKRWILDAVNPEGEVETIYLNESDQNNYVMVQSHKNHLICILNVEETGLIKMLPTRVEE